jgi:hypothetical protein
MVVRLNCCLCIAHMLLSIVEAQQLLELYLERRHSLLAESIASVWKEWLFMVQA